MYDSDSGHGESQATLTLILVSLFFSVVLEFLPWPGFVLPYKPLFPLLMLIYWIVHRPRLINYSAAILIGIVMDLSNYTLLGVNVIGCLVVTFMTNHFYRRFVLLDSLAQALHVLLILAAGQLAVYFLGFVEGGISDWWPDWRLFYPSMSGALLWLLLPLLLHRIRRLLSRRDDYGD